MTETLTRLLLRVEWFRPIPTARFDDERLIHTPDGLPVYYAGHLGTIVSIAGAFPKYRGGRPGRTLLDRLRRSWEAVQRGESPIRVRVQLISRLCPQPHYRTRHHRVTLAFADRTSRRRGVHVLVLCAWVGNVDQLGVDADGAYWIDACHVDGRPSNNRLRNLVWGDRSLNAEQRERHRIERQRADEEGLMLSLFAEPDHYAPDEEFGF